MKNLFKRAWEWIKNLFKRKKQPKKLKLATIRNSRRDFFNFSSDDFNPPTYSQKPPKKTYPLVVFNPPKPKKTYPLVVINQPETGLKRTSSATKIIDNSRVIRLGYTPPIAGLLPYNPTKYSTNLRESDPRNSKNPSQKVELEDGRTFKFASTPKSGDAKFDEWLLNQKNYIIATIFEFFLRNPDAQVRKKIRFDLETVNHFRTNNPIFEKGNNYSLEYIVGTLTTYLNKYKNSSKKPLPLTQKEKEETERLLKMVNYLVSESKLNETKTEFKQQKKQTDAQQQYADAVNNLNNDVNIKKMTMEITVRNRLRTDRETYLKMIDATFVDQEGTSYAQIENVVELGDVVEFDSITTFDFKYVLIKSNLVDKVKLWDVQKTTHGWGHNVTMGAYSQFFTTLGIDSEDILELTDKARENLDDYRKTENMENFTFEVLNVYQ